MYRFSQAVKNPILLIIATLLWMQPHVKLSWVINDYSLIRYFLYSQIFLSSMFLIYQIFYWNFLNKENYEKENK